MVNGNVLLIEDDPELLRLFQFSLKRMLGDLELTVAGSGEEAVAILREYTERKEWWRRLDSNQ